MENTVRHRLYLVSASYVSNKRIAQLSATLAKMSPIAVSCLRIENDGTSLWQRLSMLTEEGAEEIEILLLGFPFSQSLENWLPGAIGAWLADQGDRKTPAIHMAQPLEEDVSILEAIAQSTPAFQEIKPRAGGEMGKGWDEPPAFDHHLLVCSGPRCHLRDSPSLLQTLKQEVGRAGLSASCLISSTACLFPCNAGPIIVHYPLGIWYRLSSTQDVTDFVTRVLKCGQPMSSHVVHRSHDNDEARSHLNIA